MNVAFRVRRERVKDIPAAVHVDGTCRAHTVSRATNPRYHAVLSHFRDLTGVPLVLNTSFNRHEPIVASPAEAVSCYTRTGMDALAIGDFWVTA